MSPRLAEIGKVAAPLATPPALRPYGLMKTFGVYIIAALCEIGGCYSVWMVLRLKTSPAWLIGAAILLGAFAWLLTLTPSASAGRTFAAYGAIYIAASLGWMAVVEKQRPDIWDMSGLAVCLIGAGIILWAPRGQ
jgi:small multidrug resistance family-3 protein